MKLRTKIIEGIIIEMDMGYRMKYKDEDNIYIKMVIQQFDGYECTQLFKLNKLETLLKEFSSHHEEISIKHLVHQKVILSDDSTNGVPDKIAKPVSGKPNWIENDNWK